MSKKPTFPWEEPGVNEKLIKGLSMRIPEPMMLKLQFLKEHEPNISVHKLVLLGIEKELDARLPKHGYTGSNRHG